MPFRDRLKAPFHNVRSRSSSPSPATPRPALRNPPANTPSAALPGNAISGSSVQGTGSSTLTGPLHATGNHSPNPRPPAIPVLAKNEAFQKAIQEYLDNLLDEDKIAFRSATDVMEKLGDLQAKSRTGSHATRTQKVQKVLQCVKQFLESVRICIQHSPEISSLVVGGLNCILTVSTPLIS